MRLFLVSFFMCFTLFSSGQKKATAEAWIKQKISIDKLPQAVRTQITTNKLSLILLGKNDRIIKPSGRQYLKCYLVNHTGKNIRLTCADGKLCGLSSQIREKKNWVTYLVPGPIYCGNSYHSQTLENEKAFLLYYDYAPKTAFKVSLRLLFNDLTRMIYSNQVVIEK